MSQSALHAEHAQMLAPHPLSPSAMSLLSMLQFASTAVHASMSALQAQSSDIVGLEEA